MSSRQSTWRKTLWLEEAIRRMTSMVAPVTVCAMGGLQPSAIADVVVIDLERVAIRSTLEQPLAYSVGVEHAWVNRIPVVAESDHRGRGPAGSWREQAEAVERRMVVPPAARSS